MFKFAQSSAHRLARPSPSPYYHSSTFNHSSRTKTFRFTSKNNPLGQTSGPARSYSTAYKMSGNRKDEPPKHEMVHMKGLLNTERRFGDFRTVLHTGLYSQLVAMEVPVGGDIGDEVHTVDQILLFTSGKGLATVAGKDQEVAAGDVVIVPAGTQHQFVTKGDQPLELITVYAPAEHDPKSTHKTKEEGDKLEDDGKDEAPDYECPYFCNNAIFMFSFIIVSCYGARGPQHMNVPRDLIHDEQQHDS